MQKKLVVVLAAMVLVLAVASALLWTHLRSTKAAEQQRTQGVQAEAQLSAEREQRVKEMEKEQARTDKQNQELANLTQSLRANEAKQGSNLTTLVKRLAGGAANAAGEQAASSGAGEGFSGMMEKMMKDPSMREMMRSQQKSIANQMYGPMFKELGLTSEQRQKFMDIQLDSSMKSVELAGSTIFKGDSPEKSQAMKAVTDQQTEKQASMKALLGDEKFAQYKDYEKNIGERMQLNHFKQQLEGTDAPLQDGQLAQLLKFSMEEKTRLPPVLSTDPSLSLEAMEALKSEAMMNKHFLWQAELNKRVLERAAPILSPGQLTDYREFLDQQLSMQRLGTKMTREMFGGGKTGPGDKTEELVAPGVAK